MPLKCDDATESRPASSLHHGLANQRLNEPVMQYVRAGERLCIKCLRHGGRRQRESGLRRRYLYVVGTIRTSNDGEG
jgi:hypothetical protein